MKNYYNNYILADNLLRLIAEQKSKQFPASKVLDQTIIDLLLANGLATSEGEGKEKVLLINNAGNQHLLEGGYKVQPGLENDPPPVLPDFKQHLEDNTNLLTIFGIFNAIMIFADGNLPKVENGEHNFLYDGMISISIAMYLLSIMVLIELICNSSHLDENIMEI